MSPIINWLKTQQRRLYIKIKKLKGKPVILARGLAVGVFAGFFPFFGIQSIIGVLLATILRGSKVAAVAGTWISNPLTYVPIYVFNYKVGKFLLGIESISSQEIDFDSLAHFMEFGSSFVIALLVGCTVVGLIFSVISYFVGLHFFQRLRTRRKKPFKIAKQPINNSKISRISK
jgi:uncharacterized protein (DUF2062 family)